MGAMADFWPKLPPPSEATADSASAALQLQGNADPMDAPADAKTPPVHRTYVHVAPIAVSDAFDDKYKASIPPIIQDFLAKAVNGSAKLTTDEAPAGFYLDGSLALTKTDTGIAAKLAIQLGDWPSKSLWGFAVPKAATEVRNLAKIDQDVDFLIHSLLEEVQAKIVTLFEKKVK